jgi:triacylglycerol esterase/lipase EstA (alpha/beta hydrolase family)
MGKSKYGCLILFFFINSTIKSQNYEQLLTDAQSDIQEKNYCKAVEAFNLALKTQEGVAENNPFVFYTAATSAGYCGNNEYAIGWLSQAEKKGLVSKTEELSYVESDSAFIKLHALKEWSEIINSMKGKINEKKIQEDKLNKEWNSSILENVLNIKNKKKIEF